MAALACAVVLKHSVAEICVPRTPVDVTRDASMSCVVLQAEAAAAEVKDLQTALATLTVLGDAEISVREYAFEPRRDPEGNVTHEITVSGGDQPGLVARLCETFVEFGANIVTLNAGPQPDDADRYGIRLSVSVPDGIADACIATVKNTAEAMGLSCDIRQA